MSGPELLNQSDIDHLAALSNARDREGYYDYLSRKGYPYGDLAGGVVTHGNLAGRVANSYMANYADSKGKSINFDTSVTISLALMNADLAARRDQP